MKSRLLILALCLSGEVTQASGVITGGGGGVLNPRPVAPDAILTASEAYGGSILQAWFQYLETDFNRLLDDPKNIRRQLRQRLFQVDPTIFDILKQSSIEVRMSEPCFDAGGHPMDASIYASAPNTICLSAFSMAPKLGKHNFEAETLGLIAHELSHLVGTKENEAVALQEMAVEHFSGLKFRSFLHRIDDLKLDLTQDASGSWQRLQDYLSGNKEGLFLGDVQAVKGIYRRVIDRFLEDDQVLSVWSKETISIIESNFLKIEVAYLSMCSIDPQLPLTQQQQCKQALDWAFVNRKVRSAPDLYEGLYCPRGPRGFLCWGNKKFGGVLIRRPESNEELKVLLGEFSQFIQHMVRGITDVQSARLPARKN